MVDDVRRGTGVAPHGDAGISRRLETLVDTLPDARSRALARQLFVVVFETIISATPTVARVNNVVDSVWPALADHAANE